MAVAYKKGSFQSSDYTILNLVPNCYSLLVDTHNTYVPIMLFPFRLSNLWGGGVKSNEPSKLKSGNKERKTKTSLL